jgi:hypothetical protein
MMSLSAFTGVRRQGQAGAGTGPPRGPTAGALRRGSRGLGRAKKPHCEGNIARGLSGREAGTLSLAGLPRSAHSGKSTGLAAVVRAYEVAAIG